MSNSYGPPPQQPQPYGGYPQNPQQPAPYGNGYPQQPQPAQQPYGAGYPQAQPTPQPTPPAYGDYGAQQQSPYNTYPQGQPTPQPYGQPAQPYGQQPQGYGQQQEPYGFPPAQPAQPYGYPQYQNGYGNQYGQAPVRPPHNFGQAIKAFFRNYVNFSGRAGRGEYWYPAAVNAAVYLVLYILMIVSTASMQADINNGVTPNMGLYTFTLVLMSIYALAMFLPTLGVTVRRLHDVGLSGWMYLIALVPFGWIYLLVQMAQESKPEGARFDDPSGAQPKLGTD